MLPRRLPPAEPQHQVQLPAQIEHLYLEQAEAEQRELALLQ